MGRAAKRYCCLAVGFLAVTLYAPRSAAQTSGPGIGHGHFIRTALLGRLPRGSFINVPVQTVPALVSHVQHNAGVAERYARLFQMSPHAVVMAFKQLKQESMPEDRVTRVYFAHGKTLGYRMLKVRKGTPIFAMPDGTPTLVLVCGNPVVAAPEPPILSQPGSVPDPSLREPDFAPPLSLADSAPDMPGDLPQLSSPEPEVAQMDVDLPGLTPAFVEDTGVLPSDQIPHREPNLTPALALAMLSAFISPSLGGFGGGGSSIVPIPGPGGGGTRPPRVLPQPHQGEGPPGPPPAGAPEPGAAELTASAAAGLVVLAARRRRLRARASSGSWRSGD